MAKKPLLNGSLGGIFASTAQGKFCKKGGIFAVREIKAEINADAWATLHSDTSRLFEKPKSGCIAVKIINHLGGEVMKVFKIRLIRPI